MQSAMLLTRQKPTQTDRFGEVCEGLSGSTLERGMGEEKRQELGRRCGFQLEGKLRHGKRILRHILGKPLQQVKPNPKPEWKRKKVGQSDQKE